MIGFTEWLFQTQMRHLKSHVGYIWIAWAIVGLVMVLESAITPWWTWSLWLFVIVLLAPWNEVRALRRNREEPDQ